MSVTKLLVANRGEIAVRIMRAARDLDIPTVAVASEDDVASIHTRVADHSVTLGGRGPGAYLDIESIVAVAADHGCDAVHPGYGFLAENAGLARACQAAGITFVGPTAEQLERFGRVGRSRPAALRGEVQAARASRRGRPQAVPSRFNRTLFRIRLGCSSGHEHRNRVLFGSGARHARRGRHGPIPQQKVHARVHARLSSRHRFREAHRF